MVRVAINGFGRIGRAFIRSAYNNPNFEVVAINDLVGLKKASYLLKYDSVYGRCPFVVGITDNGLKINNKEVKFLEEKNPEKLPWKELDIDIVIEATGLFTKHEDSKKHLIAGAKRVVVTSPVKDDSETPTVLMGVNEDKLEACDISSNASCTTNATSPVISVLGEAIGIEKAILNVVHAYTSSQSLTDGQTNKEDVRKNRAAALNIVPTTTGAAIATTKAHTSLEGKFTGISLRVPVAVGSIVDITFIASRNTTVEEVNDVLKKAATNDKWKGLLSATDEPIVSSDIIGSRVGSIVDLSFTTVSDGNLVKVLAWFDNETSYVETLIRHVLEAAKYIKK